MAALAVLADQVDRVVRQRPAMRQQPELAAGSAASDEFKMRASRFFSGLTIPAIDDAHESLSKCPPRFVWTWWSGVGAIAIALPP